MQQTQRREGFAFFVGFIATIWMANWLITHWGTMRFPGGPWLIEVWPGVYAPSGVLAIGLGFTLRDLVQRRLGVKWAAAAIVIGAALSAVLSPSLAVASGGSFLLAEGLDLFVYTPLQRRHFFLAVVASNLVGLVADSIVFLSVAFGSLALLEGQIVGKLWMTVLALPIVYALRWWDGQRGLMPVGMAD